MTILPHGIASEDPDQSPLQGNTPGCVTSDRSGATDSGRQRQATAGDDGRQLGTVTALPRCSHDAVAAYRRHNPPREPTGLRSDRRPDTQRGTGLPTGPTPGHGHGRWARIWTVGTDMDRTHWCGHNGYGTGTGVVSVAMIRKGLVNIRIPIVDFF